ncbi:MAG TPA: hypothetical protein VIY48_16110 [Candidatus Paceibacterota bacterium]
MKTLLTLLVLSLFSVGCGDNAEPQYEVNPCAEYQAWSHDASMLPYVEVTTENTSVADSAMQPLFSSGHALHDQAGHNYAMLVKAVKLHWIDGSVRTGAVLQDTDNNMCMWADQL